MTESVEDVAEEVASFLVRFYRVDVSYRFGDDEATVPFHLNDVCCNFSFVVRVGNPFGSQFGLAGS